MSEAIPMKLDGSEGSWKEAPAMAPEDQPVHVPKWWRVDDPAHPEDGRWTLTP